MCSTTFSPFYERLARYAPVRVLGKVTVSALLGLVVSVVHYAIIKDQMFDDWSWFLGLLIGTAMLCLYYATYTLNHLIPRLQLHMDKSIAEVFTKPLKSILSDRNFCIAGFVFGVLNSGLGFLFGPPYSKNEQGALVSILAGYFLAGFVCGMAVFGIFGVVRASRDAFAGDKRKFDYAEPDHCGGTKFMGDAFMVFGGVTLIVGVMISVYILQTKWEHNDETWVRFIQAFWIVFPYGASLYVLLGPAGALHRSLNRYKIRQEIVIQDRLLSIRDDLDDEHLTADARKALQQDYEFNMSARQNLHRMRTWPFGIGANLRYLGVLIGSAYASTMNVIEFLEKVNA